MTLFSPLCYSIPLHSSDQFVWYRKVKYDPLEPQEIYDCCKEFTEQMHEILEELHEAGFAHCDLRPDNICIDEEYHLTLIDMDRVTDVESGLPSKTYAETCMYTIPDDEKLQWTTVKLDYMQLGLLLAYVLMLQTDWENCPKYHKMNFDEMPPTIKFDRFLKGLLCKGKYDGQELEGSVIFQGKSTIEEVICRRQCHN